MSKGKTYKEEPVPETPARETVQEERRSQPGTPGLPQPLGNPAEPVSPGAQEASKATGVVKENPMPKGEQEARAEASQPGRPPQNQFNMPFFVAVRGSKQKVMAALEGRLDGSHPVGDNVPRGFRTATEMLEFAATLVEEKQVPADYRIDFELGLDLNSTTPVMLKVSTTQVKLPGRVNDEILGELNLDSVEALDLYEDYQRAKEGAEEASKDAQKDELKRMTAHLRSFSQR